MYYQITLMIFWVEFLLMWYGHDDSEPSFVSMCEWLRLLRFSNPSLGRMSQKTVSPSTLLDLYQRCSLCMGDADISQKM